MAVARSSVTSVLSYHCQLLFVKGCVSNCLLESNGMLNNRSQNSNTRHNATREESNAKSVNTFRLSVFLHTIQWLAKSMG